MSDHVYKAVIVGAGPAGLTAAYELGKKGQRVVVLEADPRYVGGISRTVEYHGFRFDIGGHRFFSKSREVEDLWTEILGADMLERPRSSRIFYRGKFYAYPLKPLEALSQLGVMESALCILSFLKTRLKPVRNPRSLEDWVVNEFGDRLFRIFFKTYTEKVWGMSCKEISADWAAQRIKGLTLGGAIRDGLRSKRKPVNRAEAVKTLMNTFRYPRLGPGMMWEACAEKVRSLGGEVLLGRSVVACHFDTGSSAWTVTARTEDGATKEFRGEHLVSSMPMRQLVGQIEPRLPEAAVRSGNSLRYRDFLTIALILRDRHRFTDNWIYIHDPNVKMGRVQNYKSWSPEMVPDPNYCCYGLEYFCFEGDGLWTMRDADLIALGAKELQQVGLGSAADLMDGCVVRQPKAYPVYDDDYQQHVGVVRRALDAHCPNLHLVGRNGMHKYNNQDHAMITAMLAARNILAGENKYDVWSVNEDGEYHEAGHAGAQLENDLEQAIRMNRS
ncbi:MAG TPA: NAD(P)/FAD-dependent oxidoreductase [Candidatus Sulfotelmatobacter sp.]|jgi:protoporphyrinogen oxidase|nr:NAD(P)/FAD-dependent oxidoreductase [Candidatus Sulfotelmatobacter sp.]